jgi:hypothetical protein
MSDVIAFPKDSGRSTLRPSTSRDVQELVDLMRRLAIIRPEVVRTMVSFAKKVIEQGL